MSAILDRRQPKTKSARPAERLLAWWDIHRRDLPWRAGPGETADPYAVWLSEILLQQTTVAAATPYFLRFMARWPSVADLAAAPIEDVMRSFAGLGYYSRARNMHACAQEIARCGGAFPQGETALRKLPGIGAYTSAAIAAIAFNAPASPVDGNIARIVARLNALDRPIAAAKGEIAALAAKLTPQDRPGDFAQAMMDLGATICTPRNPDCRACPLTSFCAAFATSEPEAFPRKATKSARPLRKGVAFFLRDGRDRVLMRTRPPKGLLGGTVELPGGPWSTDFDIADALAHAPCATNWRLLPSAVGQIFTHFSLELTIYAGRVREAEANDGCYWVADGDVGLTALSSVMSKAIAHALKYDA